MSEWYNKRMCNDTSNKSQCNRRPFASDDGCDRGNVDISQFGDLPYCGNINPTLPSIPPEIQDVQMSIPLPAPNCSCFNIDYKFDLKYNENRSRNSFSTSASFVAQGDCCEGNYETRFKLRIPCPVKNNEGTRIRLGISYGDGPQDVSASFISADSSNCIIEPLGPRLMLNIPCPAIGLDGEKKISAAIRYGDGSSTASATFLKTDAHKCTLEGLPAKLDLNIRCPVRTEKGIVAADVKYGVAQKGDSGSIVVADHDKCDISLMSANMRLNIPCPVRVRRKNKRLANVRGIDGIGTAYDDLNGATYTGPLRIKADCRFLPNVESPVYASFGSVVSGCGLRVNEETALDLKVPCPVKNNGGGKIKVGIGYGNGPNSASASFISTDNSRCNIEPLSPAINLNIPCPVSRKSFVIETVHSGPGSFRVISDTAGTCSRRIKLKVSFKNPSFNIRAAECTNLVVTRIGDSFVIGVYYV